MKNIKSIFNGDDTTEQALDEQGLNDVTEVVPLDNNINNRDSNVEYKSICAEDSDDDNHDAFFNQIFNTPVQNPPRTDAYPDSDDSDNERCSKKYAVVKFFNSNKTSALVAEYDDIEYHIGFLDVTYEQYLCMGPKFELRTHPEHIVITRKTLQIKRINERQVSPQAIYFDEFFDQYNCERIQFSRTEPLMAKYRGNIYLVGSGLCSEYAKLLHFTQKPKGTAIRIHKSRVIVHETTQNIDTKTPNSYEDREAFFVTCGSFNPNEYLRDHPSNDIRRFVLCYERLQFFEVDAALLHSSIYDDCPEIIVDPYIPSVQRIQRMEINVEAHQNDEDELVSTF